MISILIDTNILYSKSNNLLEIRFIRELQNIIDEIQINDIYTEVKIILPRVVVYELLEQQKELFDEWMTKLSSLQMPNLRIDREYDYDKYLKEKYTEEMNALKKQLVDIEIQDFPNDNTLPLIIERALRKTAPFEGKNKKSDKGFKDVIIWETLKSYKKNHIGDCMILYCNDNLLLDNILCEEYQNEFRDKLFVAKKGELNNCLEQILKKHMVRTFSENLEAKIKILLSEDNEFFYDWYIQDCQWSDGDRIEDFKVESVSRVDCNDVKYEDQIRYDVDIQIILKYATDKEREEYKYSNIRNFVLFYDFNKDDFYVSEYDSLTLGRGKMTPLFSLSCDT